MPICLTRLAAAARRFLQHRAGPPAALAVAACLGLSAPTSAAWIEEPVTLTLRCEPKAAPISELIYGIAFHPRRDHQDRYVWDLNPGARRWGGNPASRFNWQLDNAWNTGADWYFMNLNFTGDPQFSWRSFLEQDRSRGTATALTLPTLGWVAKDTSSYSYPVSLFGPQRNVSPFHKDAGDGRLPDGSALGATSPDRTSVVMTPEKVGAWVRAIRALDRERRGRHVQLYVLDNEPMLWHVTHGDVRGRPLGYDELLERTLRYAQAVRRADPEAQIAGPAEWGWPAYFFSAVDAEAGFALKPDRRRHGDVPLIEWYLRQLRDHERKTGIRLLDVLDIHYYPQAKGVFLNQSNEPRTAALRLRSTRSLWDPSYEDESWIKDKIALLPRFEKIIRDNYPGTRLAIGEYNFGGEDHISGGLALAEVLGRFGQDPNLYAAFYWTYPPEGSPAYWAFRAFRNYDGEHGRFQDYSLPAQGAGGVSLFASRDQTGNKVVAIAVHPADASPARVELELAGCPGTGSVQTYRYTPQNAGITRVDGPAFDKARKLHDVLPPSSISIYEFTYGPTTADR